MKIVVFPLVLNTHANIMPANCVLALIKYAQNVFALFVEKILMFSMKNANFTVFVRIVKKIGIMSALVVTVSIVNKHLMIDMIVDILFVVVVKQWGKTAFYARMAALIVEVYRKISGFLIVD